MNVLSNSSIASTIATYCACRHAPISVGAPLDPGDHAFLSYGPVSNDGLLQYYGFVERDNPSDTYVLQDMGKWLREVRSNLK